MAQGIDNEVESAFNEGMLQIQRLHVLWEQANKHSRYPTDPFFKDWWWILQTIWRELSRDALKNSGFAPEPEEFNKKVKENEWFKQFESLQVDIRKARLGLDRYEALSRLEVFLRVLQQAVGKGGKYKDKDEDDME